jgi:hypothetical protein
MKTIRLLDHELSVANYSNFELNLLLKEGRITTTIKPATIDGIKRVRLIDPVIVFDEARATEKQIESLVKHFQFQHKSPS